MKNYLSRFWQKLSMGGGKKRGKDGNVIRLPTPERSVEKKRQDPAATLFRRAKAGPEELSNIRMLPHTTLTAEEAINSLRKFFPDEITSTTRFELGFPDKVRFNILELGVEFFDVHSMRPWPFDSDEPKKDLEWVKHWYFAVFIRGDILTGRFLDRSLSHPWLPFEQPLRHPSAIYGKYSLTAFIETINYGKPPD